MSRFVGALPFYGTTGRRRSVRVIEPATVGCVRVVVAGTDGVINGEAGAAAVGCVGDPAGDGGVVAAVAAEVRRVSARGFLPGFNVRDDPLGLTIEAEPPGAEHRVVRDDRSRDDEYDQRRS